MKKVTKKIIVLSILFQTTYVGNAINYYVNAITGNNSNSGLSTSQAKKTIQSAADLTNAGDTVLVMTGTYTNSCAACNVVNIIRSGSANTPIVYMAYPGNTPKLQFNGWAGFSLTKVSYIKLMVLKL